VSVWLRGAMQAAIRQSGTIRPRKLFLQRSDRFNICEIFRATYGCFILQEDRLAKKID
jgi:hypothetical protein